MLMADTTQPSLWSVPPAIALAALLVVFSYTAAVRGAAELRGWLLLHSGALVPYALTMVLAPSLSDPEVVTRAFRVGAGAVPLAAAAGLEFRLALIGGKAGARRTVILALAGAMAVACSLSPWFVSQVALTRYGFWFAEPGPLAPLWVAVTVGIAAVGQLRLWRAMRAATLDARRRQLRRTWVAHAITSLGLLDVVAAYHDGWFPLGWLLIGVGSVVMLRAMVIEELLSARAIDTRAPLAVVNVAGAALLGWSALELVAGVPWWAQAVVLVGSYASVHLAIAVTTLITRGARVTQGTRARFVAELSARFREVVTPDQLEALVTNVAEIGLEAPAALLVPSGSDWGWSRGGQRLADELAPDPLLVSWLTGQGPLAREEIASVAPPELRPALDAFLAAQHARLLVPLRARDELLGLLMLGGERPLAGAARQLAVSIAERSAEALSYFRIARQVGERALVAREVELAAQIQAAYLPMQARRQLGRLRLIGEWQPATECGGDFWAVYELSSERTLVVVGDVTGHGMPAALVTAAVRGACDVAVRALGEALELPVLMEHLDAAVRRVGAERLHMSCVAAVVDAEVGEVSFVNAGHATPYLVRAATPGGEGEVEVLLTRGHALGAGHPPGAKVSRKSLGTGDLLLWYTDGLVDVANPANEKFGDRRLQRMLRALAAEPELETAARRLLEAVSIHRGGAPFSDDVTLVLAKLAPPAPAVPRTRSGEITVTAARRPPLA